MSLAGGSPLGWCCSVVHYPLTYIVLAEMHFPGDTVVVASFGMISCRNGGSILIKAAVRQLQQDSVPKL